MTPLRLFHFGSPSRWLVLVVFLCCASCQKGGGSDPSPADPKQTDFTLTDAEQQQSAAPGLGNSTAMPSGKGFAWPAGVVLQGPIQGLPDNPPDSTLPVGGNGLPYVRLFINLSNTTAQSVPCVLPGGLQFISEDTQKQNGLLVQADTIWLKPGLTSLVAGLYCLNENRQAADEQTTYQLGPVTQLPAMVDLLKLLSTKSLAHWSRLSRAQIDTDSFLMQSAVWQIAHTGQLPTELRTQLEQLP